MSGDYEFTIRIDMKALCYTIFILNLGVILPVDCYSKSDLQGTIRATIVVSGVRSPYILSNLQDAHSSSMDYDLEEDLDLGLETFE